jgi:hypothetical protein
MLIGYFKKEKESQCRDNPAVLSEFGIGQEVL